MSTENPFFRTHRYAAVSKENLGNRCTNQHHHLKPVWTKHRCITNTGKLQSMQVMVMWSSQLGIYGNRAYLIGYVKKKRYLQLFQKVSIIGIENDSPVESPPPTVDTVFWLEVSVLLDEWVQVYKYHGVGSCWGGVSYCYSATVINAAEIEDSIIRVWSVVMPQLLPRSLTARPSKVTGHQ